MNPSTNSAVDSPQTAFPRPSRRLVELSVVLGLLIVLSMLTIVFIKHRVDLRLDKTVFRQTEQRVGPHLGVDNWRAEEILTTALRTRPQLLEPLICQYADHLAVMPQFRSEAFAMLAKSSGHGRKHTEPDLLRTERALCSGLLHQKKPLFNGNSPRVNAPFGACPAFTARKMHGVDLFSDTTPARGALDPLPQEALLKKVLQTHAGPQNLTRLPRFDADYLLGVAAFCSGRLTQAKDYLQRDWHQAGARSDTAFLLGFINEAQGEIGSAGEWYAKAVATGQTHLEAARALLRLSAVLRAGSLR